MSYASEKERKLSFLLREVCSRAQDLSHSGSVYDQFVESEFPRDLFYARVTGKFLGILGYINHELQRGKRIEEIRLD